MKKKYWISLCIERPEDDSNLDQNFSISAIKYFKDTEIEYFSEEIDKPSKATVWDPVCK